MQNAKLTEEQEASRISQAAQKAAVLEVMSSKPGNVTPEQSFKDTAYTDFLAGAGAMGAEVKSCAMNGIRLGKLDKSMPKYAEIGSGIKRAASDVKRSHKGGNTHLGMITLFVPLATAYGMSFSNGRGVKENLADLIANTTAKDAVDFYDAVNIAGAGGLGNCELDVRGEESKREILDKGITFLKIMEISAGSDDVAKEIVANFDGVFRFAQRLAAISGETKTTTDAVMQLYLTILAERPDTLIAKKRGMQKAEEVSVKARKVIGAGGVGTAHGRKKIAELDAMLRSENNELNPGTTADITAAAIMVAILEGLEV